MQQDLRERKELLVVQEQVEHLAHQEQQVLAVLVVLAVQQEQVVHQVLQEELVRQEHQEL